MFLKKNYLSIKKTSIKHGFFTRLKGLSKKQFKSLNCSISNGDNKKIVFKNRLIAMQKLNLEKKKLILIKQTHSSKVIRINKTNLNKNLEADGMITSLNNIVLGVLTADCAPIFIFDPKKKIIAAIHAGWKGAYKKIIYKTVYDLKKKGSNIQDLIVVIGPCISKYNYEVKKDFLKKFINQNKKNRRFFNFSKKKIFFSLNEYIKNQLKDIGVKNIEIINKDTYLKKNNFFSYRRSLKNKYYDYGRNISVIMIK